MQKNRIIFPTTNTHVSSPVNLVLILRVILLDSKIWFSVFLKFFSSSLPFLDMSQDTLSVEFKIVKTEKDTNFHVWNSLNIQNLNYNPFLTRFWHKLIAQRPFSTNVMSAESVSSPMSKKRSFLLSWVFWLQFRTHFWVVI